MTEGSKQLKVTVRNTSECSSFLEDLDFVSFKR